MYLYYRQVLGTLTMAYVQQYVLFLRGEMDLAAGGVVYCAMSCAV